MAAAIENKSGLSHYRKIEQLKPKHPQRAGKHIIAYSLENTKNRSKKTMLYEQGKTMQQYTAHNTQHIIQKGGLCYQ